MVQEAGLSEARFPLTTGGSASDDGARGSTKIDDAPTVQEL